MKLHRITASSLALLAAWFVLSVLSACRSTPTAPSGDNNTSDSCCHASITMHVHDSATGHAISGGTFTLSDNHTVFDTAHANGDGVVAFHDLCPGRYVIHGSAEGYQMREKVVELTCNQQYTSDFNLPPTTSDCCGGAIILNVHDSATGHLMTGGSYGLSGNGVHQTATINDHGQVIFTHLCPGTYEVVGEADGYNRHVEHYTLGCNDEQHHDFNLSPLHTTSDCCHGIITLILRDSATHTAIGGGTVTLWKGSTNLGSKTISADGTSWDGLCQGDGYSFSVSKDGYNHYEWNIEALGCNEHRTTDHNIGTVQSNTNCDNASMTLTVMDSVHRDSPVAGASVTIRISGHSDVYASGTTDDHGHFTANHLLGHTTYSIRVAKDGYGVKEFTWQITDCHDYTESVWLAPH